MLNSIDVLISCDLIYSKISHDQFVLIKNVLNAFMKDFSLFIKQCCHIVWGVEKIQIKTRNKIINKFLLAGIKFMLEMHLRQPGFTYSACRPST